MRSSVSKLNQKAIIGLFVMVVSVVVLLVGLSAIFDIKAHFDSLIMSGGDFGARAFEMSQPTSILGLLVFIISISFVSLFFSGIYILRSLPKSPFH